jgi:hypothetical protein
MDDVIVPIVFILALLLMIGERAGSTDPRENCATSMSMPVC